MVAQVTALSHMQTYGMNKHYWVNSFIQRHMGNVLRESQKQTRNTELTWYMTVSLDVSHTLLTCIFMPASFIKYMWKVLYDQYRLTTITGVYSFKIYFKKAITKNWFKPDPQSLKQ